MSFFVVHSRWLLIFLLFRGALCMVVVISVASSCALDACCYVLVHSGWLLLFPRYFLGRCYFLVHYGWMLYGSSHNPTAWWQHNKKKQRKAYRLVAAEKPLLLCGSTQTSRCLVAAQKNPATLWWHNKALLGRHTTKN